MPTLSTVIADLKSRASEKTRATYIRHGAPADHTLGVSNADMKLIAKTIKKQQALACELYETSIFDAMYLAGLVADGAQLSSEQLHAWANAASAPMIFEYTIPWLAVENKHAHQLAMQWILSAREQVAAAGWRTYSGIVTITPDDKLNLPEIEALLQQIPSRIKTAPNRVRATMNHFVIAVGSYVAPLLQQALATAKQLGAVAVDVGDTACEIPLAAEYIAKMQARAPIAKRKTIRC